MRTNYKGKYTHQRRKSPKAIARCDYSGLMVAHSGLRDQYQYAGTGLVKTGFKVYYKFLDKPNAQELAPLIYVDPKPVLEARPDTIIDNTQPSVSIIDVNAIPPFDPYPPNTLNNETFSKINLIFTGALASDMVVQFLATYHEFYAINNTTGAHTLSLRMLNSLVNTIELPQGQTLLLCCDSMSFFRVPT